MTWDNNEIKWITGGPSPQVGFDFKLNAANSSVLFDIHDLCGSVPTNKIFIGASKTNPSSSTFTLSSGSTPNPNGQPNYNPGADKGIFIWLDGSGVWHLRASDQRSSGVVSTGNSFNQVTSAGLEVDPAPRLREKNATRIGQWNAAAIASVMVSRSALLKVRPRKSMPREAAPSNAMASTPNAN